MPSYSSKDAAKAPNVILQDFGSGYGTEQFTPANLRGAVDEAGEEQPLAWDQETHKFSLPPVVEDPITRADGKWIASSCWDGHTRIWDAETGTLQHKVIDGEATQLWAGRFSPDSKHVAIGAGPGTLRVWEVATGELTFRLTPPQLESRNPGWCRGVQWASATQLWASYKGGLAVLYDLASSPAPLDAAVLQVFRYTKEPMRCLNEISRIIISDDGNRLGFKDQADSIFVYDVAKNERWSVVQANDPAQRQPAYGNAQFLDPAGHTILSGDGDGCVRVWNLR